jgi:hypothetical protein
MLDVLHFFFEEDSRYSSGDQAKAVEALRTSLYETMYHTKYRYTTNNSGNSNRSFNSGGDFNFDSGETKSYIPPTDFNPNSGRPFGEVLEAPLG